MRILKRILIGLVILIGASVLFYFVGPKPQFEPINPDLPVLQVSLADLDAFLAEREGKIANLKAENESRIIWADSIRQTEYAIVYLHGFSAGPMEGAPLHQRVAERYGMNLYLPRLSKHGVDDKDIFAELTPFDLMEDAKEALIIGRMLGKKVILMSCSTGSTLGIYLSAYHPIDAHIMYSPNIALFNPTGKMLTGSWGLQIARQVVGEYRVPAPPKEVIPDSVLQKQAQYWSGTYRVEGLVALQSLIDQTMQPEIFEKVSAPYFMGYYYKNDSLQDMTVSVAAMLMFDKQNQTPTKDKRLVAFEEAGAHVINSPLISKEYEKVENETFRYFEEVLGIETKKALKAPYDL